jgi:hypothetical protein
MTFTNTFKSLLQCYATYMTIHTESKPIRSTDGLIRNGNYETHKLETVLCTGRPSWGHAIQGEDSAGRVRGAPPRECGEKRQQEGKIPVSQSSPLWMPLPIAGPRGRELWQRTEPDPKSGGNEERKSGM